MNISKLFNLKTLVVSLALAVLGVLGVGSTAHALPQDCDPNSIINCGVQSKEEFRAKYNSSSELQKLYAHPMFNSAKGAGLQGNDIDRFVASAQMGKLCKNGELTLDNGQKVFTNGWSMGRNKNGNPYRYAININTGANNNTYYYGTTQNSFGKNTTCLPVWVMFNDEGEAEFTLITACGNISWGDNVKPKYSCDKLNKTEVSGKKNTYKFTTNATAENAQIVKVVYDFGDGSPKVEKTNPSEAVEHTYTKTGTFTARVTVVVSLPGNITKEVTSQECTKPIEVKEEPKPDFNCKALDRYLIEGNRKYKFVATGYYKNAELVSATFDFGDGQKAENITKKVIVDANHATITVEHQYAKEKTGKLTATADLKFKVGNDFQNKKCTVPVELTELTCKDTPEKPECNPPKEILPKEIVKTGPAEIAAGALGLGSLAGAGMYYRASRRNLLDKFFKRQ